MVLRVYGRCGRRCTRWWALLGGVLSACWWLSARAPPGPLRTEAHFPHLAARTLAHTLADFTNHPHLYPHLGTWAVEGESGNYSAWRYEVSYTCGVRCGGRAVVLALDPPPRYTVIVSHRSCTHPPLLPWPQFCEEWETETAVSDDGGGGAVFVETAWGGCGALRRLLSALNPLARSCAHQLGDARREHLHRLTALLQH